MMRPRSTQTGQDPDEHRAQRRPEAVAEERSRASARHASRDCRDSSKRLVPAAAGEDHGAYWMAVRAAAKAANAAALFRRAVPRASLPRPIARLSAPLPDHASSFLRATPTLQAWPQRRYGLWLRSILSSAAAAEDCVKRAPSWSRPLRSLRACERARRASCLSFPQAPPALSPPEPLRPEP